VPPIDIAPRDLDTVLKLLACHIPDRDVRAFGSRVTGAAKRFSDLDLVIMGDRPLDLGTRGALVDAFDESDLPFTVDLIDWASASASFQAVIEGQATLVRAASSVSADGVAGEAHER
jgi:predicted nucleotidyltransferase